MIQFPLKLFRWDKNRKTLSVEASTLECVHKRWLSQLRADSTAIGFSIKSEKTGNVIYVVLKDTIKQDGDTRWWELRPEIPLDTIKKVLVWNT